jgi:hypothetical protein
MTMPITLFLSLAVTLVIYAVLGQGGGVAGLVFFGILLIGASLRILRPRA